jgi:hypothetical protein
MSAPQEQGEETEPVTYSQIATLPFQYTAVYEQLSQCWWVAADTREKAQAMYERILRQVPKPLYRVFTKWNTDALKKIAALLEMPSPSGMIH